LLPTAATACPIDVMGAWRQRRWLALFERLLQRPAACVFPQQFEHPEDRREPGGCSAGSQQLWPCKVEALKQVASGEHCCGMIGPVFDLLREHPFSVTPAVLDDMAAFVGCDVRPVELDDIDVRQKTLSLRANGTHMVECDAKARMAQFVAALAQFGGERGSFKNFKHKTRCGQNIDTAEMEEIARAVQETIAMTEHVFNTKHAYGALDHSSGGRVIVLNNSSCATVTPFRSSIG
jgi:cell fate (sporulation/competence/biofilm development) regulator YlbF (YheA/YmcA/DUF963 family)